MARHLLHLRRGSFGDRHMLGFDISIENRRQWRLTAVPHQRAEGAVRGNTGVKCQRGQEDQVHPGRTVAAGVHVQIHRLLHAFCDIGKDRSVNGGLTLGQRCRRWTSVNPTLYSYT